MSRPWDFNPRSHEGSDHVVGIPFKDIWDFNPRSHEGSDINADLNMRSSKQFQSTLPRGERHRRPEWRPNRIRFQSTLPRGERQDTDLTLVNCVSWISIHAPTRGATPTTRLNVLYCQNFNPRSHEGSDLGKVPLQLMR